jgi:hypothetical protein
VCTLVSPVGRGDCCDIRRAPVDKEWMLTAAMGWIVWKPRQPVIGTDTSPPSFEEFRLFQVCGPSNCRHVIATESWMYRNRR